MPAFCVLSVLKISITCRVVEYLLSILSLRGTEVWAIAKKNFISVVFSTYHTSKHHQELFVSLTHILYARHGRSHVRMAAAKMSITGVTATMTFQPITLDIRWITYCILSYDPYGPASAFFAKPYMKARY